MNAVKVDSAKRIRLTVLTPGDYYEPEVRGGDAEEITLRRMPPPRRRFTRLEALRAIEKSPLRFTHSWDPVKEEPRGCAGCRHRAAVSPGWRRFGRLKKARCGSPIAGTRSKRRPGGDSVRFERYH